MKRKNNKTNGRKGSAPAKRPPKGFEKVKVPPKKPEQTALVLDLKPAHRPTWQQLNRKAEDALRSTLRAMATELERQYGAMKLAKVRELAVEAGYEPKVAVAYIEQEEAKLLRGRA